jgi:hypothetical protein
MFLVGHAMVAFLIAYLIIFMFLKNGGRQRIASAKNISFALVMLIGTLPDVDIFFQILGVMPHKTFTHSILLSAVIVAPAIFVLSKWPLRQTLAASMAYALAYAQHMLDDIVVGTLNVAYPFGNLPIGFGIPYGSVYHLVLECVLVGIVTAIIMGHSFRNRKPRDPSDSSQLLTSPSPSSLPSLASLSALLFRFRKIDKICYTLLLTSFIVSFAYLLHDMKSIPRLSIESNLEVSLFALLHVSALALLSFLIFVSGKEENDGYNYDDSTKRKKSCLESK